MKKFIAARPPTPEPQIPIGEVDERALQAAMTDIINDKTRRLILFLDYDGTLVIIINLCLYLLLLDFEFPSLKINFIPHPELFKPDAALLSLLTRLGLFRNY